MIRIILLSLCLNIFLFADTSSQETLELEKRAEKIRKELGIHIPTAKEKKIEHIRHELKIDFDTSSKKALFGTNTVNSVKSIEMPNDTISVASWFGLEKKKKKDFLNIDIFDTLKNSGDMIFRGMKYSGKSAEFSSGMVYKGSKIYNTMFEIFEDSPLNIFEDEKETSFLDILDEGNEMLDMFECVF